MTAADSTRPTDGDRQFMVTFPPAAPELHQARHRLATWLEAEAVPAGARDDLVAAASELCTNAVSAAHERVEVHAWFDGPAVVLEVVDDGPGMGDAIPDSEPDPLSDEGRGLYLVRQLVDVLWVSAGPSGGTTARCARRVR